MKPTIHIAAFALALGILSPLQAQEVTTTQTTTTQTVGTVNEIGTDALVIRSETASSPLRYSVTESTTYVDEAGQPVDIELIRAGYPVTVHYDTVGDRRVASKVIVRKSVGGTTTTTTTSKTQTVGTISELGDNMIVVRSEAAGSPLRYRFTDETIYVDENGDPVEFSVIKSGLPVTVHYDRTGDAMIARKVIVRQSAAPAAERTVIEKTETETITTGQ